MNKPKVWSDPIHFLAFGFGSGLAPKAPGTCGTIAAIPVYLLLTLANSLSIYLLVTVLFSIVGIWICDKTSKDLGVHDYSGIVWDEIVGYLITMLMVPVTWYWVLIGFILFRFFDILKPWPISILDKRVSGGFGIMIDDVVAGLFALVVMQILIRFI